MSYSIESLSHPPVHPSIRFQYMMRDYQVWIDRGMPEAREFKRDLTMHEQIERWCVNIRLHPRSRQALKEEYDAHSHKLNTHPN